MYNETTHTKQAKNIHHFTNNNKVLSHFCLVLFVFPTPAFLSCLLSLPKSISPTTYKDNFPVNNEISGTITTSPKQEETTIINFQQLKPTKPKKKK